MGFHSYLPRCAGRDYRGDTREEALLRAEDALESALAMYIAAGEPLPVASNTGFRGFPDVVE